MSDQTPAGWYPDPENSAQQRYWSGSEWTDSYAPQGQPPPQKGGMSTGVKALIGIVGVLVLIGACGALLSGGSDSDKPTAKETQTQAVSTPEQATTEEPVAEPTEEPTPEEPQLTRAQENAIGTAQDYLDYDSFSRKGLIEQLEFEGYSTKDATFAVVSLNVDWNEQAAKKAEDYLDYDNFSRSGLIEQLEFEGFTTAQATYGVNQTGL